ncbi:MAG: hypothetical protein HC817_07900 [Saprospiraceae bacterium]|nr:hypothetical protein [Saprospiraceae bacterium]
MKILRGVRDETKWGYNTFINDLIEFLLASKKSIVFLHLTRYHFMGFMDSFLEYDSIIKIKTALTGGVKAVFKLPNNVVINNHIKTQAAAIN